MRSYELTINGNPYKVIIKNITEERAEVELNGKKYNVQIDAITNLNAPPLMIHPIRKEMATPTPQVEKPSMHFSSAPKRSSEEDGEPGTATIVAPIPGTILNILVEPGQSVEVGQVILKMEAMKMENEIKSTSSGIVSRVLVKEGDSVMENQDLVVIGAAK
jgi:biotin carboxyl carrier protein